MAKQRADILVTHEGLGGAMDGQPVLNTLAEAIGVSLVVHGHLHKDIDYLSEGRIPVDSLFSAYGVNKDSHMRLPPPHFDAGSERLRANDVSRVRSSSATTTVRLKEPRRADSQALARPSGRFCLVPI